MFILGFLIPAIVFLAVVAFCELPKLFPLVKAPVYESMPFAKLDPPVVSKTPRWWFILHVTLGSLLAVLIFVGWQRDLVYNYPLYNFFLDLCLAWFVTMIFLNMRRLGAVSINAAMAVNIVSCVVLVASALVWTISQDQWTITIALFVGEMMLFTAPLVSAIVTGVSMFLKWCRGKGLNMGKVPDGDLRTVSCV